MIDMRNQQQRVAEAQDILTQPTGAASVLVLRHRAYFGEDLRLLLQEICIQGMIKPFEWGMKALYIDDMMKDTA